MKDLNVNTGASDTSSITSWDGWGNPYIIDTILGNKSIELVYRRDAQFTHTVFPVSTPNPKIFKIIYSCKNGKWHKSEKIKGYYVSKKEESYEF